MARTAGKKQAPQKFEEPEEAEGWEDAVVEADGKDGADLRLRDWRDVERFREMKDLRRLVDDDYGLEEIFRIPLKPRSEALPRANKLVLPARLQPSKAAPAPVKAVPAKAAGKAAPHAKKAAAPHKAPAKAHPKPAPSSARARSEGVRPKAKKR
jgi:hypothetical protein